MLRNGTTETLARVILYQKTKTKTGSAYRIVQNIQALATLKSCPLTSNYYCCNLTPQQQVVHVERRRMRKLLAGWWNHL